MSYRLPDTLPEYRRPLAHAVDVAHDSIVVMDAGTICRVNVPCFYGRRMSRNDLMLWDHFGWPSPGRPDRSDYARINRLMDIDLETEGYTTVSVEYSQSAPVTITGTIDHSHVVLTFNATDSDSTTDEEIPFAVYITGTNDEAGQLKDLVTKGRLRIVAALR